VPVVRVEMWEGRSLEQKRRIARELTDALVRIIDCDPATVRVLIDEYSSENWAVGGTLRVDATGRESSSELTAES
jgi:4-oxalocrotonate tautomerase